jgi:hypothetical protein
MDKGQGRGKLPITDRPALFAEAEDRLEKHAHRPFLSADITLSTVQHISTAVACK